MGSKRRKAGRKRNPGLRKNRCRGEQGRGTGDSRTGAADGGSRGGPQEGGKLMGLVVQGDSQARGEDAGHVEIQAPAEEGRREAGGGGNPQVWGPGEEGREIRAQGSGGSPRGSARSGCAYVRALPLTVRGGPCPPTQSPPPSLHQHGCLRRRCKIGTGFPSQILGWSFWNLDSSPTSSPLP